MLGLALFFRGWVSEVVWFVMLLGVWDNLLFLCVDAFDGLTECFVGVLWVFSVV